MGYDTKFKGELKFTHELTASQLARLNAILGEDCREHPEWEEPSDASYIDLILTDKFDGLRWDDGTEKTHDLPECVNLVIRLMRDIDPAFGLTGQLAAQGEEPEDRWTLYMDDGGIARKQTVPVVGQRITCPHCDESFVLESEEQPT